MKYIKPINEFWGDVLKRDLLGETREEDKFHSKEELRKYIRSEREKQGDNVVFRNLDVSLIEDLSSLFEDIVYGVKTLDLSGWKTGNVKYMDELFWNCFTLQSINLSGWDTSKVEDMSHMFYFCEDMKSLDLTGWDFSSVENMHGMFYWCSNLRSLDLSGWNTSNVTNMEGVFSHCRKLESLDLSGWDTSNVKNMGSLFWECPAPYEVVDNKIVRK